MGPVKVNSHLETRIQPSMTFSICTQAPSWEQSAVEKTWNKRKIDNLARKFQPLIQVLSSCVEWRWKWCLLMESIHIIGHSCMLLWWYDATEKYFIFTAKSFMHSKVTLINSLTASLLKSHGISWALHYIVFLIQAKSFVEIVWWKS